VLRKTAESSSSHLSDVTHGHRLYLFGGWNGDECLNDLYSLDIEKDTWSSVSAKGYFPEPRRHHKSHVFMHYLLIAGGEAKREKIDGWRTLRDLHVLDLSTGVWETIDDGMRSPDHPWMERVIYSHSVPYQGWSRKSRPLSSPTIDCSL